MPGDTCIVCGKAQKSELTLSFHRFPKDAMKRAVWLNEFGLSENLLKTSTWVCSIHFHSWNPHNRPDSSVEKRFASPLKKEGSRSKRAKIRQLEKTTKRHDIVIIVVVVVNLSLQVAFLQPHHHHPWLVWCQWLVFLLFFLFQKSYGTARNWSFFSWNSNI